MLTHRYVRLAVAIIVAVALAAPATARRCRGGMPNYDPATEMTISGTVERVSQQECQKGCRGLHLWLATEAETYEVHLGPARFLNSKSFELAEGDELSIIGAPLPDDEDALIARQIDRDDETLTLRDRDGRPEWRGGGGRRGRN